MATVALNSTIRVGDSEPLLLIAGPCQIESLDHCLQIAEFVRDAVAGLPINFVFKSSFDKANRTSLSGKRGLGIEQGLKILSEVRARLGVPVLTDVHSPEQCAEVAAAVDVLQIPAFLCRQTDLLIAAGKTGKTINVKKGQFLHPLDMRHVAEKIRSQGNDKILLCERGTSFGYQDLVVDMRGLVLMRQSGYPVIFDATHSVQRLGDGGNGSGQSGGNRQFVAPLLRAAVATGVDGVFVECHEAPERAPSDGASMLPLNQLPAILSQLVKIRSAAS